MKKLSSFWLFTFSLCCFYSFPLLAQWSMFIQDPPRKNMGLAKAGTKALFAGGYYYGNAGLTVESNRLDIYDGSTGQLTNLSLGLDSRHAIGSIGVGNLAFFAGGRSGLAYTQSYVTAKVDIYNATNNQLTTAQLSEGRSDIAAGSAAGKVLFGGGNYDISSGKFNSNTVDIYDIIRNQWDVTALPKLSGYVQAVSTDSKIVFLASQLLDYSVSINAIDIYDVLTSQWTSSTLSQARSDVGVIASNNKVFFAGGSNSNLVDIYDAATNQWTTAQLSQARSNIGVATVGNKVFFAGGSNNSSVVDIYDTSTNQWTTAQLAQGRSGIVSTIIGSKVFFAGGNNSSIVDIYDNTTNQWSTTNLPNVKVSLAAISAGENALFVENNSAYAVQPLGKVDLYGLNAPLPVNLISFSGKWNENIGTQLNWQTALETNNNHFDIQRSANASSFETIGRVQGTGTINTQIDYNFIDAAMPGQIGYYRLKQVDFDGSVHFSKIIAVSRQLADIETRILISPMPTTGTLSIHLSSGKTISQTAVFDLVGRRLYTQTGGQSTANVSSLQMGVYLLEVLTTDGERLRRRFIKQ